MSKLTKGNHAPALLVAAMLGTSLLAACSSTPTQQSTGEAIDDGVVTARVKAKLIEDPVTKAHQINVDTYKGTVQLSGFVEDDQTRTRALQLARDVDGVKQVKDGLQVRKGTS
ncbi:MAG TPA: BON domain-containing protein [Povalibacter sp.]|jgi:osmotically-inducible protein OsmY